MRKLLSQLADGQSAVISKLNLDIYTCRRLQELGFVAGTQIRRLYGAPFGKTAAFLVRGAVFALREQEASRIALAIDDS